MTPPAVTVVVATRDRAPSLAQLLDDLAGQQGAPAFEVIVADNGSTDGTAQVVERARSTLTVRSVRVEGKGKGRALNAAFRAATGDLVVMTDDDVRTDPRWLAELHCAAARNPESVVFGGTVEVDSQQVPVWVRRSPWLMGLLVSEHLGHEERAYEYAKYPFGPNMAFRRSVIAEMDRPYPEDLGPGTALPVGDERAFFLRFSLPEARDRIFVPSARVAHEVRPSYFTLGNALRRCFHAGRAHGWLKIRLVPPAEDGKPGSLIGLVLLRLQGCGSFREFLCLTTRQLGFLWGTREARIRSG